MISITQCPHCQTRFRVGSFQLTAARGLARCGACLAIFNARRHCILLPSATLSATTVAPLVVAESVVEDEKKTILSLSGCAGPEEAPDPISQLMDERVPLDLDWRDLAVEPAQAIAPKALVDEEETPPWRWQRRAPVRRAGQWRLPAGILGGGVLGLSLLYSLLHFDELARHDQTRPWLEHICPVLGCTLPLRVDLAQIKSSNLVVQTHPEFKGALFVEALLYNRAPYSQPFPVLELSFTDINGWALATRRFNPSEYLGDDPNPPKEMPPQTPIHVQMDVLDPGENAVSYTLSFRASE